MNTISTEADFHDRLCDAIDGLFENWEEIQEEDIILSPEDIHMKRKKDGIPEVYNDFLDQILNIKNDISLRLPSPPTHSLECNLFKINMFMTGKDGKLMVNDIYVLMKKLDIYLNRMSRLSILKQHQEELHQLGMSPAESRLADPSPIY